MFLSDLSIKRPIMVSMLLIVFIIFGSMAYFNLSLELTPEINVGFITIHTVYPGAGPVEVESQVTKKIEDAVSTISQIDYTRSYSLNSVSLVTVAFLIGKDVNIGIQEIKDKIDGIVNDLPGDAELPTVSKFDMNARPVMDIVLTGKMAPVQLYELADKKLKDRFSQIQGVARVDIIGGQKREIKVELDNRILFEHRISLASLSRYLSSQNIDMPAGRFQKDGQEYDVKLEGKLSALNALMELEIPTAAGMKKLRQIASVHDGGEEVRERAVYFRKENSFRSDNIVLLSIVKSSDGNTVKLARAIQKALPLINRELPAGLSLSAVQDRSLFVEGAVSDTLGNIFLGIGLTALVLFFFLHDFRSVLIASLSMPFSIISTFLLLQLSGFTLNLMTLMGLSTAVGVLVTNSVVVLENIFRFKSAGAGSKESAAKGTAEIVLAVLASTLTNIMVFLPIASMSGIIGQFFKQFALTVTFATLFSLLVSFTLTPMMASLIIPDSQKKRGAISDFLERLFERWELIYRRSLHIILKNRLRSLLVLVLTLILLFLSLISAGKLGFEFIPLLDEGDILVEMELPQGYHLNETLKKAGIIEKRLRKNAEVKHLLTQAGKLSETDIGVNLAKMEVKLVDASARDRSSNDMANLFIKQLSDIPGMKIRVGAISSLSSGGTPIEFYLQGSDTEQLERYKRDIIRQIKSIPGLVNLTDSSRPGKPEVKIIPNRKKMSDAGITMIELAMTIRGAIEGLKATKYKEMGDEYDIRIQLQSDSIDTPENIGKLSVVSTKTGLSYPIRQLAEIRMEEGFSKIIHRDKIKSIQFNAYTAAGFALGDVVDQINSKISQIQFTSDYRVIWGGDVALMDESTGEMMNAFLIAILLTYMLLAAILENLVQPLMILGTVPLAMIGVFFLLDLSGLTMNVMSMMAIVMLIGIVVNNGILLLDYTNTLRKQGQGVTEALLNACPTKLKPILMSTIAIILGMLPMAMGIGSAGREFRQPMGVVSIGGLITSGILALYVIPAIYNLFSGRKKQVK